MKHYVIGRGTLGQSLAKKLDQRGHMVNLVPSGSYNLIEDREDSVIWNTIGFGSVGECKANPNEAFRVHVAMTNFLVNRHKLAELICFSTNYVVDWKRPDSGLPIDEHLSDYSYTKGMMEHAIRSSSKNNVFAVRVANLYSAATREKSLAYRLLANADKITSLPENEIIPTDTDWLAEKLAHYQPTFRHLDKKILGMAPNGSIPTREFGEKVLGKPLNVSIDKERPYYTSIHNDFHISETWQDVWAQATEYRGTLLGKCLFN